jgi:nicotinamidase-related amidase
VPYLVAEQYPQGLGSTLQALQPIVPNNNVVKKVHFSCWREPLFQNALQALNKKQVVLMGIETHVCVLQTAFDLQTAGYHVFVVIDAVGSRHEMDYKYALKRMKQAGIELVTSEMVFFEWVEKAATPEFKMLSKAFLQ